MHCEYPTAPPKSSRCIGLLRSLAFTASLALACEASATTAKGEILPPSAVSTAESRVIEKVLPLGWKMIGSATGDLNRDGNSDWVLVFEENNPLNRKSNHGLGPQILNLNPRRLVILFHTPSGFREVLSKDRLIPSENDENRPCLIDPFLESGDIRVRNGLLRIDLHYWLICGSYSVNRGTHVFRHENGRFRLIGLDETEFMRNSGAESKFSINYLTGMKKITSGLNGFETSKPTTVWEKIPAYRKIYLDEINSIYELDE